jgi:hypothetical protein
MDAVVDRLKEPLSSSCFEDSLSVDAEGRTHCQVVEIVTASGRECPPADALPGRTLTEAANPQLYRSVLAELLSSGRCGGATTVACDDFCLYTIAELSGSDQAACQNELTATSPGFCYIDASSGLGNPELVNTCPPNQKRLLRFTGENTPRAGALLALSCPPGE